MQTREGETKNDFKELMYVGLFTRLYKRAAVCGKQSMRPTAVQRRQFGISVFSVATKCGSS